MLNIVTYLNEMLKGEWTIFNFAKLFVVNIPKEPTNEAFVNFHSDPYLKKKDLILILNSVSGDDKSCVKFTPPVGENVAINLGSNGFPIVNSLAPISTNDKLHSSPNSSDLTWIPFSGYELEGDPGVPPRGSHLRARHKNHSQVSLAIMMMLDDDEAHHKNHFMPVVRLAMIIVKVCVVLNRVLRYRRWMWILRVKWISQELFEFSPPKNKTGGNDDYWWWQ